LMPPAPESPEPTGAYSLGDPLYAPGGIFAGKFKLREKLGEGGMGKVFVADQLDPVQRRVALKVLKAGLECPGVAARLEQERQALALMDHPNIAKVFLAQVGQGLGMFSLPETLLSARNLGRVYYKQKKYPQAEALLTETLVGHRKVLSGEHPWTLGTLQD